MSEVSIWFNSSCSKCRGARELLEERGVEAEYIEYLKQPPTRADIERVMSLLGITDPRAMMRTGESIYSELGLGDAGPHELIEAMLGHPILIERPIVVIGDRAVIARPPEKLLDLLG
ncbi:MAG TPA: arsenate reductase (glutaredoxin) [Acidimicrobiales bacterium]|nr:arsenate reductase (glutaredoxin) [Acidimicrobiales bacterium]